MIREHLFTFKCKERRGMSAFPREITMSWKYPPLNSPQPFLKSPSALPTKTSILQTVQTWTSQQDLHCLLFYFGFYLTSNFTIQNLFNFNKGMGHCRLKGFELTCYFMLSDLPALHLLLYKDLKRRPHYREIKKMTLKSHCIIKNFSEIWTSTKSLLSTWKKLS